MTTRLGVSTSVLEDKADLDGLLVYSPAVVEFYNYPSAALPDIARFCAAHDIRPALHTPVPYDDARPLTRFAPTGPDPAEAEQALRLATSTVECAAALAAAHVVVHFPSPYPPYPRAGFDDACETFLDRLEQIARREGVAVLLENLTPHPLLNSPEHYRAILDRYPGLGFCLDLGHAHLAAEAGALERFVELLGARIRSTHLYNTTRERKRRHGHEIVRPDQTGGDGFIDVASTLRRLMAKGPPDVVILEHSPVPADRARAAASWVDSLLAEASTARADGPGQASRKSG